MQRGFQGEGTLKSPCLPLSLLETLYDNSSILYKNIIWPVPVPGLKIVSSQSFSRPFPAEGELLVLLLDQRHCTEVHGWSGHSPVCFRTLSFFLWSSVELKLWGVSIYMEEGL